MHNTDIPTRTHPTDDLNTKYVTFHREAFDAYTTALDEYHAIHEEPLSHYYARTTPLPSPLSHNHSSYPPPIPQLPEEVLDAVVIRRQDVFASPALHAYATTIEIASSVIASLHPDLANNGNRTKSHPTQQTRKRPTLYDQAQDRTILEVITNLRLISDYFHTQAELAANAHHKIPD